MWISSKLGLSLALVLGAGVASAGARMAPEPVRRTPVLEVAKANNVAGADPATQAAAAQLFPGGTPDDFAFVAGDLVVPSATTVELALFTRSAGRRKGIRWFCDAYAAARAGEPSLAGLLQTLAAQQGAAGALAGDALACASPGGSRRRPHRVGCAGACFGARAAARAAARLGRDVAWLGDFVRRAAGTEDAVLSSAACRASAEQRASFDATACEDFLAPWRRRQAFGRALGGAAREGQCLRIRAVAHPVLELGASPSETLTSGVAVAAVACP